MMQKLADATYPIESLLKQRWSPRAFTERLVEIDKLLSLWEAARWSASCANQQPWYFIVARRSKLSMHACSAASAKIINCGPLKPQS